MEGVKNSDKKWKHYLWTFKAGVLGQDINMLLPTFKEGGGGKTIDAYT